MKQFNQWVKSLFSKKNIVSNFSFGEREKDGFAPVIKDGVKTNCRMYLWDEVELNKLIAIGKELQNKNLV